MQDDVLNFLEEIIRPKIEKYLVSEQFQKTNQVQHQKSEYDTSSKPNSTEFFENFITPIIDELIAGRNRSGPKTRIEDEEKWAMFFSWPEETRQKFYKIYENDFEFFRYSYRSFEYFDE